MKNAFLYKDFKEVYMNIPPGYEQKSWKNKVCKLKKSVYGLKWSLKGWFGRFIKPMLKREYFQSQSDHTLFIKGPLLEESLP